MPRIARVVAPGVPHHVTQRGNRRQRTFFTDDDYRAYISLIASWSKISNVEIWAYCLMPNHVHFIAVPAAEDGLRRSFGEAHRRYTLRINRRMGWKGHLWQGRFSSCPMDEVHLLAAARYIELNPVTAGLVESPEAYPWSSAQANLLGKEDILISLPRLPVIFGEWARVLAGGTSDELKERFRCHERTGRPIGSYEFLRTLENDTGRQLVKQKPGRKPNDS